MQAPADVLWTITHSREYVEREIARYYNEHLRRAPDRGASSWVEGAVAGRFPLEWVEQNIMASPEYWEVHYGSILGDGYPVTYWYYDVLGRSTGASDGERAYWADRSRRIGRLGALREVWYSDEAVRHRINEHYKDLLYRFEGADIAGLNYWSPKERESDINVQVLLASTPEYRSKREYG